MFVQEKLFLLLDKAEEGTRAVEGVKGVLLVENGEGGVCGGVVWGVVARRDCEVLEYSQLCSHDISVVMLVNIPCTVSVCYQEYRLPQS